MSHGWCGVVKQSTFQWMFVSSLYELTKDTSERAPSVSSTQTSGHMWPGLSSSVDGALLLYLITCVMEWSPPAEPLCYTVSGAARTCRDDQSHLPHLSLSLLSDQNNNNTWRAFSFWSSESFIIIYFCFSPIFFSPLLFLSI